MTRTRRFVLLPALALGVAAPALTAQVSTPPPPKEEKEDYVPAPRPVAPAPRTQPGVRAGSSNQGLNVEVPVHKELAQLTADGTIIRYELPLDVLGMVANPFIGSNTNAELHAIRARRWAEMEQRVLQNLDLFDVIAAGAIDGIGLGNIAKMQEVAQTLEPLVESKTLTVELESARVFTPVQTRATSGIVQKYQGAINAELKELYEGEYLDHFMRFIMNESFKDAKLAYENLVRETLNSLDALREADLPGPASNIVGDLSGLAGASDTPIADAIDLLATRSVEDRQALFNAVIANRADPAMPDIPVIDFGIGSTTEIKGEFVRVKKPFGQGYAIVPGDRKESTDAEYREIERKALENGTAPEGWTPDADG